MFELSRLATLPASIWRGYRNASRQRATTAALSRLSDQTLRDIGLHRGDIQAAARRREPQG